MINNKIIIVASVYLSAAFIPTSVLAQSSVINCNGAVYKISSNNIEVWNSDRLRWRSVCAPNYEYIGDVATCSIDSENIRWTNTTQPIPRNAELPRGRAGWTREVHINRLTGRLTSYTERTNGTSSSGEGQCAPTEDPSLAPRTPLF